MATYTSKYGDNFSITVTVPAVISGGAQIQNVGIAPDYPIQTMASFEGKKYVPGLPKVNFQVQMLFLESPPTGSIVDDSTQSNGIGASYTLTVDTHEMTGVMDQVQFSTQDFGDEGIKGIQVTPRFVYVGTRDPNCS